MPGRIVPPKGRCLDRAVIEDEKEVHPAKFFDPAPFGGVEEDYLVKSLRNRFGLRNETRGVVAAAFCRSRASGRCPCVILRNPERNRRGSALEIAADRRCEDQVDIFGRGLHAEENLARKHERPQIERAPFDVGKPVSVNAYDLPERFDKQVFGKFRHGQPLRRIAEPFRVRFRPEQSHAAIGQPIGLEPFENLLRIVKHSSCGID
jgi:hypothetical protein